MSCTQTLVGYNKEVRGGVYYMVVSCTQTLVGYNAEQEKLGDAMGCELHADIGRLQFIAYP